MGSNLNNIHLPFQTTKPKPSPSRKPHQIVTGTGDVILHTLQGGGDPYHTAGPGGRSGVRGSMERLGEGVRKPPKFSAIVNEYLGVCLDDNCKIGRTLLRSFCCSMWWPFLCL